MHLTDMLPAADGQGHRLIFDLVDRGPTAYRLAAKALAREGVRDYAAGPTPAKPPASAVPAPVSKPAPQTRTKPPRLAAQPKVPATGAKWRGFIAYSSISPHNIQNSRII